MKITADYCGKGDKLSLQIYLKYPDGYKLHSNLLFGTSEKELNRFYDSLKWWQKHSAAVNESAQK